MVEQKSLRLLVVGLVLGALSAYLVMSTQLQGVRQQFGENITQLSTEINALEEALSNKKAEYAALSEHSESFDAQLISLQNDVDTLTFAFTHLQDCARAFTDIEYRGILEGALLYYQVYFLFCGYLDGVNLFFEFGSMPVNPILLTEMLVCVEVVVS
jgi:hypothetical protein